MNGRQANLTLTTRRRLVTLSELDRHISSLAGIIEYKLVQTDKRTYELYLVNSEDGRPDLSEKAEKQLKNLYGASAVIKVIVRDDIPPENSGKYLVSRASFPIDLEKYLERDLIF